MKIAFVSSLVLLAACAPETESDATARPTSIPEWAVEVAPDVYSLGPDIDPETGDEIEGFAFVDRQGGDDVQHSMDVKGRKSTTSSCYASIGLGSWKTVEAWGLGAANSSGLSAAAVQSNVETAIALWEASSGANIFGDYTSGNSGAADIYSDGQNNIQFGDAGGGGTVAVTYVWGTSWGKPATRSIYEWDQIYEDGYEWTIGTPSASAFDFLNVSAHEVGHAAGLDHPSGSCIDETMYAYVDYGETNKQTLNAGDIAGIDSLY